MYLFSAHFHAGIQCDVCGVENFQGVRWSCLQCEYCSYDRCDSCHNLGTDHIAGHYHFLCIPASEDTSSVDAPASIELIAQSHAESQAAVRLTTAKLVATRAHTAAR